MRDFILIYAKFLYTILIVFTLTRFIYYRNSGKAEFVFTNILLATMISFMCMMVSKIEINLGFAIGLFAIFGVLRFRTSAISPREMTYIFLCAGIAGKNMLMPLEVGFAKILLSDASILVIAGLAEYFLLPKKIKTKQIVFIDLSLIHPDKRELLDQVLLTKYGISDIVRIEVGKIDEAKNTVRLRVHFKDEQDLNFEEPSG